NMSTLKALKEYLVGAGGYLLNDDNNGKTVMLSGAWGSGKTHFWQNEIEEDLTKELKEKNKACVYVSLYGKDNIEVIKSEILQKAYSGVKKENTKQTKAISAFGMGTKILAGISIFGIKVDAQDISNETKNYYDEKKIEEATDFLSDGGLICFDDFERKSKKIDLNDLFGFISQLAIDMNCKIVIILNSDVFEGEEANVFKTVKEKTVNKFFYFEPTIEELFNSIYESNEKYKKLDVYRAKILKAIEETEELNARIYIQVLDNCLEWIENRNEGTGLKVLVLVTVNFILNNFVLDYLIPKRIEGGMSVPYHSIRYKIFKKYPTQIADSISRVNSTTMAEFREEISLRDYEKLIGNIERVLNGKTKEGQPIYTAAIQENYFNFLNNKKNEIKAIWKYGYELYCMDTIDEATYKVIANFVKSGILLKLTEEPSS
ncbi:MAG: hypothetical protein LGB70_07475, partial [Sulfurovum sp.]|nr:hypothetical protein [Sulfurovum sp.]